MSDSILKELTLEYKQGNYLADQFFPVKEMTIEQKVDYLIERVSYLEKQQNKSLFQNFIRWFGG